MKRNIQDHIINGDPAILLRHLINGSPLSDIKLQAIVKRIYHMLGSLHSKLFPVHGNNNKKVNHLANKGVHLAKGNLKVDGVLSLSYIIMSAKKDYCLYFLVQKLYPSHAIVFFLIFDLFLIFFSEASRDREGKLRDMNKKSLLSLFYESNKYCSKYRPYRHCC